MRQTIRLTESELRNMIEMSINEAIEDEGKVRQGIEGLKSFFGRGKQGAENPDNDYARSFNGGLNLKKRVAAAKTNYETQGIIDTADAIAVPLKKLIKSGKVNGNMTVSQLLQTLGAMKGNATYRGSMAQNRIYRR